MDNDCELKPEQPAEAPAPVPQDQPVETPVDSATERKSSAPTESSSKNTSKRRIRIKFPCKRKSKPKRAILPLYQLIDENGRVMYSAGEEAPQTGDRRKRFWSLAVAAIVLIVFAIVLWLSVPSTQQAPMTPWCTMSVQEGDRCAIFTDDEVDAGGLLLPARHSTLPNNDRYQLTMDLPFRRSNRLNGLTLLLVANLTTDLSVLGFRLGQLDRQDGICTYVTPDVTEPLRTLVHGTLIWLHFVNQSSAMVTEDVWCDWSGVRLEINPADQVIEYKICENNRLTWSVHQKLAGISRENMLRASVRYLTVDQRGFPLISNPLIVPQTTCALAEARSPPRTVQIRWMKILH